MKWFTIPLSQRLPWYTFPIVLADQRFNFELRYNLRIDRWILNISDATNTLILAGIPLLLRRVQLLQYLTLDLPAGALYVDAVKGSPFAQPGAGAFLTTHLLYFAQLELSDFSA